VHLLNVRTGARLTIPAQPDQLLTCTPAWGRVYSAQGTGVTYTDQQPDGTHAQRIGNGALVPLNTDVALLDRFEILGESTPNNAGSGQRLWLHDLTTTQTVVLDDHATDVIFSRNDSSGGPTPTKPSLWHVLDLHQLV
jgi:hypothetical protein